MVVKNICNTRTLLQSLQSLQKIQIAFIMNVTLAETEVYNKWTDHG